MADRFYIPGDWGAEVELSGPEAHHLIRVLRAQPGEEIELFNGCGRSARATVQALGRASATAKIRAPVVADLRPQPSILVAAASPKGERLRWMIEKATELGVDRFVPLRTARGVVDPSDHKLSKLQQTVIAACKQCGRNRLMEIGEPCELIDFLARQGTSRTRILAGAASGVPISKIDRDVLYDFESILALIGPEGGFTRDEEAALAKHGAQFVSLAQYTLRVETAAIALAAWLCGLRGGHVV